MEPATKNDLQLLKNDLQLLKSDLQLLKDELRTIQQKAHQELLGYLKQIVAQTKHTERQVDRHDTDIALLKKAVAKS